MKFVLDTVLGYESLTGSNLYFLIAIAAAVVSIAIFEGLFSYKQTSYISRAGRTIVFDIRLALFDHLQRLSLQFHSRRWTGDLMTRVTSDVKAISGMLTESLLVVLSSAIFLFAMGAVLLWMDWQLALVAIIAGPFLFLFLFLVKYTSQIRAFSRTERGREGALASELHETLGTIRLTRVFSQEEEARERFQEESAASLENAIAATLALQRFTWVVDVLGALVTAVVLGFGAYRVISGAMTPGDLIVFLSYIGSFYKPMRNAIRQANKITRAMARAERVVELLDVKEGVVDLPDARPAPEFRGSVEFRGVSLEYEPGTPTLREIDITLPAGKVTAIVGPTGAGKTTLASLIPRLYDPQDGAVLIDGEDIRKYTLKSLRSQISVVLQESVLLHSSISENIAYGRSTATFEEIVTASKAANAHDFIIELPDGYDTVVGERGDTLSGGQRQRISIARAMVRNAPILILDEPLSGLDAMSAAVVMGALERLMKDKTVIIVTHQLSTIQRAHKIVVMDEGRISQQGTHQVLAHEEGRYRQLFETQFKDILAARP